MVQGIGRQSFEVVVLLVVVLPKFKCLVELSSLFYELHPYEWPSRKSFG